MKSRWCLFWKAFSDCPHIECAYMQQCSEYRDCLIGNVWRRSAAVFVVENQVNWEPVCGWLDEVVDSICHDSSCGMQKTERKRKQKNLSYDLCSFQQLHIIVKNCQYISALQLHCSTLPLAKEATTALNPFRAVPLSRMLTKKGPIIIKNFKFQNVLVPRKE